MWQVSDIPSMFLTRVHVGVSTLPPSLPPSLPSSLPQSPISHCRDCDWCISGRICCQSLYRAAGGDMQLYVLEIWHNVTVLLDTSWMR